MTAIESLGLSEVSEVFVVREDLNGEGGAVEVVSPGLQGTNDRKEFSVIDVVVELSWGEGL